MFTDRKWFYVRLGIVALGAVGGVLPAIETDATKLSILDIVMVPIVNLMLIAFAIFLCCAFLFLVNPNSAREWRRPSWRVNPFKEPLQFFQLGSFYFIAAGVFSFCTQVLKENGNMQYPLLMLSGGIGSWLGIHLYMKVFPHKMAPLDQEKLDHHKTNFDFKKFQLCHAFVLRDSDIEILWRFLQIQDSVFVSILFSDSIERRVSSPQEITNLENSGKHKIEAMKFISQANSEEGQPNCRFKLDFVNKRSFPIEWEIVGNEAEISRLNGELKILIKGLKPWYGKISEMNFFSLMPIGGIIGGLVAYLTVALIEWRPITEQIPMSPAFVFGIPLFIFSWILVPMGLNHLRAGFFPLATFAIGQGKARHQSKETGRRGIIFFISCLIMVLFGAVHLISTNQ